MIDMHSVPYIDQSGAYMFADLMEELVEHNTRVYIAGLQPEPSELMRRLGFIPRLCSDDHLFPEISLAVDRAARDAHREHTLEPGLSAESEATLQMEQRR